MSISLTPEQESFVQSKIQAGTYRSTQDVLEIALRLLDEYDRAETRWSEDVREKIEAAVLASEHTPPMDGEIVVNQILERFDNKLDPKFG
ncbi:MAG: type II toxin-antitoxin system ParD family antitoxin [Snowella sp.]